MKEKKFLKELENKERITNETEHYDFKNLKLKLDLSSSSYLRDSFSSKHFSFLNHSDKSQKPQANYFLPGEFKMRHYEYKDSHKRLKSNS